MIHGAKAEQRDFNDRLPKALKDTILKEKLFNQGWKYDLFNVQGQMWKQMFAVAVIFAMLHFSLVGLIMANEKSLAAVVLTYSLICLATFLNLSQIRDFEAIAVNFTPVALAIAGCVSLMSHGPSYSLVGMTLSLIADGYLGVRYTQDSDKIRFNVLELFCRESWTQQCFERQDNLAVQIVGCAIIFAQIFLTVMGSLTNQGYCKIFLAFYVMRLAQYIGDTIFGVKMFQSNMTALVLAILGIFSFGRGVYASSATVILIIDAYIGLALFSMKNSLKIHEFLGHFKKTAVVAEADHENFVRA